VICPGSLLAPNNFYQRWTRPPGIIMNIVVFTDIWAGGSLDRSDAMIWGLTELFPRVVSSGSENFKSTRHGRPGEIGKVGTWETRNGKPRRISYLPEGASSGSVWARHKAMMSRRR
jgi:hypothetical protein